MMIIILALLQLAVHNGVSLEDKGMRPVSTPKKSSASDELSSREKSRTSPIRARVETRINNRLGGNQIPVKARPSSTSAYPY